MRSVVQVHLGPRVIESKQWSVNDGWYWILIISSLIIVYCQGDIAQLGERLVCNQEVTGSSPVISTIFQLTVSSDQSSVKSEQLLIDNCQLIA